VAEQIERRRDVLDESSLAEYRRALAAYERIALRAME